MIKPKYDYLLCEEIKPDSGVVTNSDITDHWQHYKVLAVGEGRYEHGVFVQPNIQVGEEIWVQKHSEADTMPELANNGLALIMASRVMAVGSLE
jgi:co-chaperonin GroES (HSP10)